MAELHPLSGEMPPLHSPVDLLLRSASAVPDAVALKCSDRELTYAAYAAAAQSLSQRLLASGVEGRPVVVVLPNSLELAVVVFAVQAAGGQVCTVNPGYTARELAHVLADAEPALVIYDRLLQATVSEASGHAPAPGWAIDPEQPDWLHALVTAGSGDLLRAPPPDSLATLQYTGGTTGRPKGVMLTHAAVAANIHQREAFLPTEPGERVLCVMPLFHVFAVSMCLHLAACRGGTLVILPRYRPDAMVQALRDERITLLPAGPTVFNGLLGFQGMHGKVAPCLKACYSGSAPLTESTLSRWEVLTGVPIYEGYGQTEAGPILTYHSPRFPRKAGSVGKALPGTAVRIVDAHDSRREMPVGESGEIVARGPQIMVGYRGLPAETADTLRDGWLMTGDIGFLDGEGYLFINDRKKDLVVTAGFNVFPREIDEVLCAHLDIAEAACVGVPDDYRGEILNAAVVLRPGARSGITELAAHCEQQLVKYKRPARIEIWETLPRTAVNKIDKRAVRARFLESPRVA